MTRTRTFVILLMLTGLICQSQLSAEELIARLTMGIQLGSRERAYVHNSTTFNRDKKLVINDLAPEEIDPYTFLVYTKQEIDSKEAQQAATIVELQKEVTQLKENLKKISDKNDALAKWLEQLEAKADQKK